MIKPTKDQNTQSADLVAANLANHSFITEQASLASTGQSTPARRAVPAAAPVSPPNVDVGRQNAIVYSDSLDHKQNAPR
jgi:hypothetical protein